MSNYWQRREEEHLAKMLKNEKRYTLEIERIYKDMLDSAQKEINAFYSRYAEREGITLATAKRRVSKLDIEAYERKAERYVKNKTFTKKANEEMRLYNLTMKVNRLEMLKANIGLELLRGHAELEDFMKDILKGRTIEELERQAGILGKTIKNNAKFADDIVNGSWQNATFSERLWGYQSQLKHDLGKALEQGLIQGKNARTLTKEIQQYFIGDKTMKNSRRGADYYAERLMRTELARVQTAAQKASFEKNGFKQYRFIVNSGCCDECQVVAKKNNGVYNVADMMPGENAPPMHPFCRCSTAAYEDSKEYEAWLEYLEKGGTTEQWDKLTPAEKVAFKATNNSKKDVKIQESYNIEAGTTILKGAMGDTDYKEYLGILKNCKVPGVQKLYAKYADKINGIKKSSRGCYRPSLNMVEYHNERDSYVQQGKHKYSVLSHEMGHYFDAKANYKGLHFKEVDTINSKVVFGSGLTKCITRKASASDEFLTAMRADKESLRNSWFGKENNYGSNLRNLLIKEHASHGVQDAIDGMFDYRIGWGHGSKYYNRKYSDIKRFDKHKALQSAYKELGFDASNQGKVKNMARDYDTASELWANMSNAIVCGGKELEFMKKYMPETYKTMLKILEGVE